MLSLTDRRYLATGASSGLGRGIAERLGTEGASVGVGYHNGRERAEEVVRSIGGDRAAAFGGNVGEEADVERVFDEFAERFGTPDGVVVNAGLQADAVIEAMTLDEWRKVMSIDLDGAFLCARAALRRFRRDGADGRAGTLVFVTSVHQFIPWAGHANYAAAKGGVHMLMRTLAQECAARGVRVNAVAPGAIRTPINEDVWSDDERRARLLELVPMGRLGEPGDVAAAVAWLLSDESAYVTGTTLLVDGGMSLYPSFVGNG